MKITAIFLISFMFLVVVSGQLQIIESNPSNEGVINLAEPEVVGGGGNLSFNQTLADDTYLKIDQSNGPITGLVNSTFTPAPNSATLSFRDSLGNGIEFKPNFLGAGFLNGFSFVGPYQGVLGTPTEYLIFNNLGTISWNSIMSGPSLTATTLITTPDLTVTDDATIGDVLNVSGQSHLRGNAYLDDGNIFDVNNLYVDRIHNAVEIDISGNIGDGRTKTYQFASRISGAETYLDYGSQTTSNNFGIAQDRGGSIIEMSVATAINSGPSGQNFSFSIYENGASLNNQLTIFQSSASGHNNQTHYARGVYNFSNGRQLNCVKEGNVGSTNGKAICSFTVILDPE
jgi:hypothetical protein